MTADFTPVPPTRTVGSGNPPVDMNNTSLELAAMGATYNVLDANFSGGADPSGTNDSTAAIQAALTAIAANGGGTVLFPPGTYKVSSALTVSGNGVILQGCGSAILGGYGTTIRTTSATANVLTLSGTGITVRDLNVTSSAATPTAGAAFSITGSGVTLDNVAVAYTFNGVYCTGASTVTLKVVNVSQVAGAHCFYFGGVTGARMILCDAGMTGSYHGANGITVDGGCSTIQGYNCGALRCAVGLLVENANAAGAPSIIYFYDFEADHCYLQGIILGGACTEVKFIGGLVTSSGQSGAGYAGVDCYDNGGLASQLMIQGMTVEFSSGDGIDLHAAAGGACNTVRLNDVHVAGNGSSSGGPYYGITVWAASAVTIRGGAVGQIGGTTSPYQADGIYLNFGPSNIRIETVDLRGNLTLPFADGGSTNTRVINCLGYNPVGVVTVSVPATGVAVAAADYDRTFYVTAAASGTTTMAISAGPTITVPASACVPVKVPAGQALTPSYSSAPSWVVEGE